MTKPRRPWWKKLLLFTAFALVAILTIVVLALSWLSFQGRRDWAKTKADLLARGEKLSLIELAPAPIPDEQNFFGDQMWKELLDTEEIVDSNGIHSQRVRLPRGKRQIDAINPALAPGMLQRARTQLHLPPSWPSSVNAGITIAISASAELRKTDDPATQQELAQLILDALAPGLAARQHIESLLDRPGAVYSTDYSRGLVTPLEHISYLLTLGQIYNATAIARLALGDTAQAAHDVSILLRLADTLNADPLFISLLVRRALLDMGAGVINRGIARHLWTDSQLAAFEQSLARINLPRQLAFAFRGERGAINQFLETLSRKGQQAKQMWRAFAGLSDSSQIPGRAAQAIYVFAAAKDQADINRLFQKYIDALESPDGVQPEAPLDLSDKGTLYNATHFLTATTANSTLSSIPQIIYSQDAILQTRIACALERYRLQHGAYPDSLDALVPAFIAGIPNDALARQKFHYRLDAPDKFRLWSVGWNETDEGGITATSRGALDKDDWVWNDPPGPKR